MHRAVISEKELYILTLCPRSLNVESVQHLTMPMPVTQHDVRLGEIYYRYLLELARDHVGAVIQYGDLVKRAKRDFPDDAFVKGAIPISIGKRLFIIEDFCIKNTLPNLACLAVNRHGVPGDSYKNNWAEEKARVAAFDWTSVEVVWDLHIDHWRRTIQPLVERSRKEAESLLTTHWRANAQSTSLPRYPRHIDNKPKEAIIRMLEKGHEPADAFIAVLFPDDES
jgi:hypothetical protein